MVNHIDWCKLTPSEIQNESIVGKYIRPLVLLLLIITFWSTPLISGFPIYSIGPGSSLLLSFPGLPVGTIGIVGWISLLLMATSF